MTKRQNDKTTHFFLLCRRPAFVGFDVALAAVVMAVVVVFVVGVLARALRCLSLGVLSLCGFARGLFEPLMPLLVAWNKSDV